MGPKDVIDYIKRDPLQLKFPFGFKREIHVLKMSNCVLNNRYYNHERVNQLKNYFKGLFISYIAN